MLDSTKKSKALWVAGIFFVVVLSVPVAIGVIYNQTNQNITNQVAARQQTLVNLTATAVKVKIDHLVGLAESIASVGSITQDVASNHWSDAARTVGDLQNNVAFYDPFVDRVIFYNVAGIQQAAYPTLVGGIGSSATSSSWYHVLSQGGGSYVSGVARRLSMPQINVVSVAVPIKSGGAIKGFLVLQIPTNNFLEFGTDLSLGTYGFSYIVDAKGSLVAHPQFSSQNGAVVDYSFMPAVKDVMAGVSGTIITYDPSESEKSVVMFEPLPQYGWGIVVQELYDEMFAARDSILFSYKIEMIIVFLIDILLSYLIYRLLTGGLIRKKI